MSPINFAVRLVATVAAVPLAAAGVHLLTGEALELMLDRQANETYLAFKAAGAWAEQKRIEDAADAVIAGAYRQRRVVGGNRSALPDGWALLPGGAR